MRIEQVGAPQSVPKPSLPAMSKGDIMVSKVTDIQGDKVTLKNLEGIVTAKLLADIGLTVGEYVETVVDEASGGRYVLRVLDVSRETPFGMMPLNTGELPEGQGQAAGAASLINTLAMLKINPGADPQAAVFLSRHGLPGSAENIELVSQMAKGTLPLATVLSEVAGSVLVQEDTMMPPVLTNIQSADVKISSQVIPETGLELQFNAQTVQNTPSDNFSKPAAGLPEQQTEQNPVAAAKNGVAEAVVSHSTTGLQAVAQNTQNVQTSMPGMAGQAVISGAAMPPVPDASGIIEPEASQAVSVDSVNAGSVQRAELTPLPTVYMTNATDNDINSNIQAATVQMMNAAPKIDTVPANPLPSNFVQTDTTYPQDDISLEQMAQKALTLLERIDDADKLATHIRKVVNEMPEQLKELKLLVNHTDINNKDTLSAKLGQAEKQMSLMSDVKRFDCYQIPLMNGQKETTADLYVFRHRNKKSTIDPENIVILLGLDTQYIGRVETLIKAGGKGLTIEFHLENINAGDGLSGDLKELKKAVEAAGYSLSNVSVKQLSAKTTILNAEETLMKEAENIAGNLDIRI